MDLRAAQAVARHQDVLARPQQAVVGLWRAHQRGRRPLLALSDRWYHGHRSIIGQVGVSLHVHEGEKETPGW